jgi:hypothetical protein
MLLVCYPVITHPGHSYPVTLNPGRATLVIPKGTPPGIYTSIAGKQEVEYGVGVHPHCSPQGNNNTPTYWVIAIFALAMLILAVQVLRGSLRKRTWGRDMRR